MDDQRASLFQKISWPQPSDPVQRRLLRVQKPIRYIGGELNSVRKNPGEVKLHMALAFPDLYEVGMSHLGLKILYAIVNAKNDLYAERVFAPWADMESLLRSSGTPLATLETRTPLSQLDFLGFSLQYELCASSVLQILELGGIPLRAMERTRGHPLIVGGGPVAVNPNPLSTFFDAFVIGDGEEVILELARIQVQWKGEGGTRADLLREWKTLRGVYVPSLHEPDEHVSRRILTDLDRGAFPIHPVVPFCETVHDRVGIEIARGCTRGCRFCQAGIIFRPVRERDPQTIINLVRENIRSTGWDEVALLSLSSGDYSHIRELITLMAEEFTPAKTAISLPSLRTDSFESGIAEQIRRFRKTGFTLAPEAGTDRLRRIINKGNTEEDLEKAVKEAFRQGWKGLKLYFMLGLPFEMDEDLDGMVGLIRKSARWAGTGRITASVSTFVPKSHTPFQWAQQISIEETRRRQHYIRRFFQTGRVQVKFHDARISFMEGVLARGDERLSKVIERAFRSGARFDGWDEHFQFDVWMKAFDEEGLEPNEFLRQRSIEEKSPWDFIHTGVRREFLIQEWEKASAEAFTEDCRSGACGDCGVCDFENVYPRMAVAVQDVSPSTGAYPSLPDDKQVRRFRLRYTKKSGMNFLGHQDVIRVFHRAFRRVDLPLDYSEGFHPHPKLRFAPPSVLGIESEAEFVDFDLITTELTGEQIIHALTQALPDGLEPMVMEEISLSAPALSAIISRVNYKIPLQGVLALEEIDRKLSDFAAAQTVEISSIRKGRLRTRNLKEWVEGLELSEGVLCMTLKSGQNGSVNPRDVIETVFGLTRDRLNYLKMVKTSVTFG